MTVPYADPEIRKAYHRAYQRVWRKANPRPTNTEYLKRWREENPGYVPPGRAESQKRWKDKNPTYHAEKNRRYNYGMEPGAYAEMVEAQGGRCAICERITEKLVVDHDHVTGRVRALLCNGCNSGLGQFGESVEALMRAAEYVQDHKIERGS